MLELHKQIAQKDKNDQDTALEVLALIKAGSVDVNERISESEYRFKESLRQEVYYSVDYGGTPLYVAAKCGKVETAQVLVDNGAQIEKIPTESEENTLMKIAISEGHALFVQWLLDHGVDPLRDASTGSWTHLHSAVFWDCVEVVKVLLKAGVDPNVTTEEESKDTPLYLAVKYRRTRRMEVMVTLLSHPLIDLNYPNAHGKTPLHMAMIEMKEHMREKLLLTHEGIFDCKAQDSGYKAAAKQIEVLVIANSRKPQKNFLENISTYHLETIRIIDAALQRREDGKNFLPGFSEHDVINFVLWVNEQEDKKWFTAVHHFLRNRFPQEIVDNVLRSLLALFNPLLRNFSLHTLIANSEVSDEETASAERLCRR